MSICGIWSHDLLVPVGFQFLSHMFIAILDGFYITEANFAK